MNSCPRGESLTRCQRISIRRFGPQSLDVGRIDRGREEQTNLLTVCQRFGAHGFKIGEVPIARVFVADKVSAELKSPDWRPSHHLARHFTDRLSVNYGARRDNPRWRFEKLAFGPPTLARGGSVRHARLGTTRSLRRDWPRDTD